jgi:hypothetical protein
LPLGWLQRANQEKKSKHQTGQKPSQPTGGSETLNRNEVHCQRPVIDEFAPVNQTPRYLPKRHARKGLEESDH